MPMGPVNVIWDVTLGGNTHQCLVSVPGAPVIAPSVEMVALQMWTAGYFCGQNKFTTTVLHNSFPIVIEGHDIGMLIPDVTIPPANLLYPVIWPFSSRKVMVTCSTVKMNGKKTGMACIPFIPMITCGQPMGLPSSNSLTSWLHKVHCGVTWGDLLLGYAKAIVQAVIDLAFYFLGKKMAGPGGGQINSLAEHYATEVLKKFVPYDPVEAGKLLVSSLSNTVFSFIEGDPKVEVKVGVPGVLELGATSKPGDASVGVSYFGGADNRGNFGRSAEGHVTRDSQGNVDTHSQGHSDGQNWDSRNPTGGSSSGSGNP
jgi:hypothetical protein